METIAKISEAFGTLDQMETESQAIISLHSQLQTRGSQKPQNFSFSSLGKNRIRRNLSLNLF